MKAVIASLFFLLIGVATVASAAPVTNTDIEKLLAAGMGDDVILNVIAGGEPKFDTSPDALIALKQKGASPAVLSAMTGRTLSAPAAPPSDPRATMESFASANNVIFIDGDKRQSMIDSSPNTRMAGMLLSAVAFGFGGRTYWVLQDPHADLRTKNQDPQFVVAVPRNTKPERFVTLTRWETRSNGTREILTKHFNPGDSVTMQGPQFPEDRVIAIELNPSINSTTSTPIPGRYDVRSKGLLKPGEYVLVVGAQCYDFGVDR
jgi:hypothetical protein